MRQTLLLALTVAAAEASLPIRRDSAPSTSSINTVSSTNTASPSRPRDGPPYAQLMREKCTPSTNATGLPDFNAPCNILRAISAQCQYGPRGLDRVTSPDVTAASLGEPQSPETERTCLCQSQFLDATLGCNACKATLPTSGDVEHKALLLPDYDTWSDFGKGAMARYCSLEYTPDKAYLDFWTDFLEEAMDVDYGKAQASSLAREASSSSPPATRSSLTPTTSSDVSLYYTMSVSGSAAYSLSMPTPESSRNEAVYTNTYTSDRQIVPSGMAEGGLDSDSDSSSDGSNDEEASTTLSADSGAATGNTKAFAGGVGVLASFGVAAVF